MTLVFMVLLLAGCTDGAPTEMQEWESLGCDPRSASARNHMASPAAGWEGTARSIAGRFEALGVAVDWDDGGPHEWSKGYYWMLEDGTTSPHRGHITVALVGDAPGEPDDPGRIDLLSYQGPRLIDRPEEIHGLLRDLGLSMPNLVIVPHDGPEQRDIGFSVHQAVDGLHLASGGAYGDEGTRDRFYVEPAFDLGAADIVVTVQDATDIASAYMECVLASENRPWSPTSVGPPWRHDLAVRDGALAHIVAFEYPTCEPAAERWVYVDVATGAVLGHEDVSGCHGDPFIE